MIHLSKPTKRKIVMVYICDEQRKLYEAFFTIHNACEQVTPSGICALAELSPKYLWEKKRKSSNWKEELYNLCNTSLSAWKIDGNGLLQRGKEILKDIKKEGKRPIASSIAEALGYHKGYLSYSKNKYAWVKKLTILINKADNRWKKKGGWEYKAIRKALSSYKKKNKKPIVDCICAEAGVSYDKINSKNYEWQKTIHQEILDAGKEWYEKHNQPILLAVEQKAKEEAHLQNLELVIYTPEELYEQFIRQTKEIDEYRNIGLNLDGKKPIALSIIMYEVSKGVWVNVLIDPSSFNPKRKHLLNGFIKMLNSYESIETALAGLSFMHHAVKYHQDSENSIQLPLNIDDAKVFYREYTHHLIKGFYLEKLKGQASSYNKVLKKLLRLMFSRDEYKNIIRGVSDIPYSITTPITVEMDEGTHALSFYFNIFHQIADFIIAKKTIPYPISFNTKRMLIVPMGGQIIQHEERIYDSYKGIKKNVKKYFNFKENRLKNTDEATLGEKPKARKNTKKQLKKIVMAIDTMNEAIKNNKENKDTKRLIEIAINSFFMLLSGFSGQTEATLKNAEWEGDEEFRMNKKDYRTRTIKPRANYRRFSFPISVYVKTALKKYLILRRIWLKNNDCNTLFPPDICYRSVYQTFIGIYPNLPNVLTMKMRQMYNQVILKKAGGDLILTANILGHAPKTNANHYNDSPQALVDKQIGEFVPHMVRLLNDENEIQTKHSACAKHQYPESYIDKNMQLDCRNIFHCFLCKHFRTHPIDEDIHKLISFLYILTFYLTGRSHGNHEFVEEAIKPTETIIKKILNFMADEYGVEKLIDKIHNRVYRQGKLAQGWDDYFTLIKRMGGF